MNAKIFDLIVVDENGCEHVSGHASVGEALQQVREEQNWTVYCGNVVVECSAWRGLTVKPESWLADAKVLARELAAHLNDLVYPHLAADAKAIAGIILMAEDAHAREIGRLRGEIAEVRAALADCAG